jgi:hypothetical protein
MVSRTSDWEDELGRWLKPFLDRLGHKARRRMCPLYVSGLIGPGESQEHYADGEASCALAHAINCITSLPPGVWDAAAVVVRFSLDCRRGSVRAIRPEAEHWPIPKWRELARGGLWASFSQSLPLADMSAIQHSCSCSDQGL